MWTRLNIRSCKSRSSRSVIEVQLSLLRICGLGEFSALQMSLLLLLLVRRRLLRLNLIPRADALWITKRAHGCRLRTVGLRPTAGGNNETVLDATNASFFPPMVVPDRRGDRGDDRFSTPSDAVASQRRRRPLTPVADRYDRVWSS